MASVVCEVIKHMMYKIDIANIYLGILLHYLLVLAAVLIFGYAFNWGNQLPVYVLAGMCGGVLILCCYLDISRVKADIWILVELRLILMKLMDCVKIDCNL